MTYRIDGREVIAEVVTEANLTLAKRFLPNAQVGDVVVTYADRTVEVMGEPEFREKAVAGD